MLWWEAMAAALLPWQKDTTSKTIQKLSCWVQTTTRTHSNKQNHWAVLVWHLQRCWHRGSQKTKLHSSVGQMHVGDLHLSKLQSADDHWVSNIIFSHIALCLLQDRLYCNVISITAKKDKGFVYGYMWNIHENDIAVIVSVHCAHSVCRCLLLDFVDCNIHSHDSQNELVLCEWGHKGVISILSTVVIRTELVNALRVIPMPSLTHHNVLNLISPYFHRLS